MAYVLPLRPWYSLAPRVFKIRTTGGMSTNPALVLSCTCAPPQWLAPAVVACCERLGRPCLPLEAPRAIPQPFSMFKQKNPFFH
jgi:hypothetical protein